MNSILKIILIIVSIVLACLGLYYLWNIVVYVLIAGVLSLVGRPLMRSLETLKIGKFKIPNSFSALLTIAAFYLIIILLFGAFVPMIIDQVTNLANIDFQAVGKNLEEPLNRLSAFLSRYSITDSPINLLETIQEKLTTIFNTDNFANLFTSVFGIINNFFSLIIAIASITFITFFFLTDKELFYNLVYSVVPPQFEAGFDNVVNQSKVLLTRYIFGVLIQIIVVTTYVTIWMLILGIENAFLIGLFVGIVNIIPYVGPVLGLAFGILVGVTTNLEMEFYTELLPLAGKIALVFVSMQLLDNAFLQPVIFSNSVKAHPLEIFILILIAGTVAGIGGMIIAIPAYTIFRVVAKEFLSEFKIIQSLTKNI